MPAALAHAGLGPAPRRRRGQGRVHVQLEIGAPDEDLTTLVDTSACLARRREAIALRQSPASPFDGLPDEVQRAWLGREHLIRANPPWTGGPPETELLGL